MLFISRTLGTLKILRWHACILVLTSSSTDINNEPTNETIFGYHVGVINSQWYKKQGG